MDTEQLREIFRKMSPHRVGSFEYICHELKANGIWRANILTMEPWSNDKKAVELIGMIVIEIPSTSWDKIEIISNRIMPSDCYLKFTKMDKPVRTKKHTYTQEHDNNRLRMLFS